MASPDDDNGQAGDRSSSMAGFGMDNAAETEASPSMMTSSQSAAADTAPPSSPPTKLYNDTNFKYKYPQARPAPEGIDPVDWNKIYNAADSRIYNKANKSATASKAKREAGETRILALEILKEKHAKLASPGASNMAGGSNSLSSHSPALPMMPKAPAAKKPQPPKEGPLSSREATPATMDMAERIKTEGRPRKAASAVPSDHDTPAPSPLPKIGSTAAQPKAHKPGPKKGTAAPTKKQQDKKSLSKPKANAGTPSSSRQASHTPGPRSGASSGDESNDGGEYCLCRGPDDHRMMVYCEGGCDDWYHCSCVDIDEEDAKELLDRFICPKCKVPGKAFTTYKPMCRYYNVGVALKETPCRKAARVTSDPPSKYCSDEHRTAFFDYVHTLARQDNEPSKGGTLNVGEVAAILKQVNNMDEFRALGQKPRLAKKEGSDPDRPAGLDYLLPEEEQELEKIKIKKIDIERKIEGYQNQLKLLRMVIDRSKLAAQHLKETKPLCGYDNRMAFNEAQFDRWSKTTEGKTALETRVLGPRTDETKDIDAYVPFLGEVIPEPVAVPDVLNNICLALEKSKCKHNKLSPWKEIHSTDFAFNMQLLRDQLQKLTAQELEIIEDAETREATKDYYANNVTIQRF